MSRERIPHFFDVLREMDPRASSGKLLRVKNAIRKVLGFWASGGGGTGLEQSFDLSTESWVLRYNT